MHDENEISIKIYDKIAEKYTERFFEDKSDRKNIDEFISLLPKGSRILDAGCGSGQHSLYFKEDGYSVDGIDLSEKMLKIAKKRVHGCKFKKMDLRELKYKDSVFDAVFAAYAIIHIKKDDVVKALKEFNRVLKNNGLLFVIVQEGNGEKFIEVPFKAGGKFFLKFFTKKELRELIESAGFSIIKVDERKPNTEKEFDTKKIIVIARKN